MITHPNGTGALTNAFYVPLDKYIRLAFRADEEHEFFIPAMAVARELKAGERAIVLFTATKVGEYPFVARNFAGEFAHKFIDALRQLPPVQIIGASNNYERERRRQPDGYHVWRDELAQTNTGIKPFGREIDELRACGDLHFNLGIGLTERCYQRLQEDRHYSAWH